MIDAAGKDLEVIKKILAKHVAGCEVRAFGSRVAGEAKTYSDLDIVIVGKDKITLAILGKLREAFQESNLPFRVDVMDWHGTSPEFRKIIARNYVVIQHAGR